MGVHKISNKVSELQELRSNGRTWGISTGLAPLDEIYSIKIGYPLFIAGSPHAGKTELIMEIMVNTMVLYGWIWCCYFGEGGELEDIFSDLCHKLIGKPYKSGDDYSMTESEKLQSEMFFDKHLFLMDDEKDFKLSEFYDEVKLTEIKNNIKFNGTIFDPFNDVVDCSADFGGRDDKWLASELKTCRRVSKKNNRIDVLVTHIADIHPILDKGTNQRYIPVALPSEWSGGRTWWRRAFVMIMVYIPPAWLTDVHGREYGKNVSLVYVQKAKPKGIAKLGHCVLNWDWQRNKYCWYEKGENVFAYDINAAKNEPKKLSPDNNFETKYPTKHDNTEAPF